LSAAPALQVLAECLMSEFVSPAAVKIAIKAHLAMHHHRPNAFVDVQLMPGGTQTIYVITTETAFVSQVQALLEDKLGRRCVYGGPSWCTETRSSGS
jgi:hypothetical protein